MEAVEVNRKSKGEGTELSVGKKRFLSVQFKEPPYRFSVLGGDYNDIPYAQHLVP